MVQKDILCKGLTRNKTVGRLDFGGGFPVIFGVFYAILFFYNRSGFIWEFELGKPPQNTPVIVKIGYAVRVEKKSGI